MLKKRDESAPSSCNEFLAEWRDYSADLLNNNNEAPTSPPPSQAVQDLSICVDPPTLKEIQTAICSIKNNKAAGLDYAVTAEALRGGKMTTNHAGVFFVEVFTRSC